jgi:hypothetical protein
MSMSNVFTTFLYVVPLTLVWLAGAIMALVTWKRHPSVSLLALLACLLLLFSVVAGSVAQIWIINQQGSLGWSGQQVGMWLSVLGIARTGLSTVGYILLLCAVFNGRGWSGQPYRPGSLDVSLRPPRGPEPEDEPRDSKDIQKRPHWG